MRKHDLVHRAFGKIYFLTNCKFSTVVNLIYLNHFGEQKNWVGGSSNESIELSDTLGHLFFHGPAVFRKTFLLGIFTP